MMDNVAMITYIIAAALALINLAGFITIAADKRKARRKMWRIPEKTLFLLAVIGGGVGVFSAMLLFRHKTRHWRFMVGIPAIIVLQAIAVYYIVQ